MNEDEDADDHMNEASYTLNNYSVAEDKDSDLPNIDPNLLISKVKKSFT